jgi:dihydropteroate synthase
VSPGRFALDLAGGQELALFVRPVGLLSGPDASAAVDGGSAVWLAGGPYAFTTVEITARTGDRVQASTGPLNAARDWAQRAGHGDAIEAWIERLSLPRPPFAGLGLDRPSLMGVLNVTPDSFSDGGDFAEAAPAIERGLALWKAGADIVDVGGESTRPGAAAVAIDEELARVVPVVEALAGAGVRLSIDTRHAAVMAAALDSGAAAVNDVTALAGDPESLATVAGRRCPAVLMHMLGEPQTMQENPVYAHAPTDVFRFLAGRVAACEAAGLPRGLLAVDPGIGFGKTVAHNLELLDHLALFHGLGCAVLLGVSRKSFIGRLSRGEPAKSRMPGSIAAALAGLARGAQILRVHDVAEIRQAVAVWQAIAASDDAADPGSARA